MPLFDDINKKFMQMSDNSKLNAQIKELERQIAEEKKRISGAYQLMGQLYYEHFGSEPAAELAGQVANLNDAKAKIEAHTEHIKLLRGITKCVRCHVDIAYGAPFCSLCGARQPLPAAQDPAAAAAGTQPCANCGFPLTPDMLLCVGCGTKVEQPVPAPPPEIPEVFCAGCGQALAAGSVFCAHCGCKVGP
jgi:hypothetical protein